METIGELRSHLERENLTGPTWGTRDDISPSCFFGQPQIGIRVDNRPTGLRERSYRRTGSFNSNGLSNEGWARKRGGTAETDCSPLQRDVNVSCTRIEAKCLLIEWTRVSLRVEPSRTCQINPMNGRSPERDGLASTQSQIRQCCEESVFLVGGVIS